MARVRSFAALAVVACVCGAVLQAVHCFVGLTQQGSLRASSVARQAAAPTPPPASSGSSDFNFDLGDLKLGEIIEEGDKESLSRVSAVFFGILGYAFVPVLKGITCGLLFAAIAYFSANGSLLSF